MKRNNNNKKKTMEKNQKFEYINREKGIVTLHYISYEESRNKAIKSLDGIDERLLNDVDFIKSIAKETKDKMLWVKIGKELKKNVDICAISLLREFSVPFPINNTFCSRFDNIVSTLKFFSPSSSFISFKAVSYFALSFPISSTISDVIFPIAGTVREFSFFVANELPAPKRKPIFFLSEINIC